MTGSGKAVPGKKDIDKTGILRRDLKLHIFVPLLLTSLLITGCKAREDGLRAGFESGRYRLVVAFGDSIVEGYRQPEGWPEILGRDLATRYNGTRVINAGVSGDTAGNGLDRLEPEVLALGPDMVLIAFGLNDMKNGRSVSRFESDMATLVHEISASGAQPVLLTTTRLQQGASLLAGVDPSPFNETIRRLARDGGVPLIDVFEESKGLNTPEYLLDVAHPNMEGYRRLAEIIREGLIGE